LQPNLSSTDAVCSHCLPDCNITTYESTITAVPFRSLFLGNCFKKLDRF
jgi:hypothetical protein